MPSLFLLGSRLSSASGLCCGACPSYSCSGGRDPFFVLLFYYCFVHFVFLFYTRPLYYLVLLHIYFRDVCQDE